MSTLNIRTINDINTLAENYKTKVNNALVDSLDNNNLGTYKIGDASHKAFNDIMNLCTFSTFKNSVKLDGGENDASFRMKELMMKYHESSLTNEDIIELLSMVAEYNKALTDYLTPEVMRDLVFEVANSKISGTYSNKIVEYLKTNLKVDDATVFPTTTDDEILIKDIIKDKLTETYNFLAVCYILLASEDDLANLKIKYSESRVSVLKPTYSHPGGQGTALSYYMEDENGDYIMVENISSIETYIGIDAFKDGAYSHNVTRLMYAKTHYTIDDYDVDDPKGTKLYYKDTDGNFQETGKELIATDAFGKDYSGILNLLNVTDEHVEGDNLRVIIENVLTTFKISSVDSSLPTKLTPAAFKEIFLNKTKIQYKFGKDIETNVEYENGKRFVNNVEISNVQRFMPIYPINLIDISVSEEEFNILKSYFPEIESMYTMVRALKRSERSSYVISVGIIYKELNVEYREVLKSDIVELATAIMAFNTKDQTGAGIFIASLDTIVNANINYMLSDIVADEILSETTVSLIKSLRANNYNARKARESDIIQFYKGDYIDYGLSTTQSNEIDLFIEMYTETRDYYYSKLLNKAFIYDELYNTFEKTFIAFYAIERFMSSKLDNAHDVDYYSPEDVSNFLISYGLEELDKSESFYGQEDYKKIIIKNFNSLVKLKGSTDVILKLIEIFTVDDTYIDIIKYSLIRHGEIDNADSSVLEDGETYIVSIDGGAEEELTYSSDNGGGFVKPIDNPVSRKAKSSNKIYPADNYGIVYNNENEDEGKSIGYWRKKTTYDQTTTSLQFIESSFNSRINELNELYGSLGAKQAYDSFVNPDGYWDKTSESDDYLASKNIDVVNTKYVAFELSKEISSRYAKTRYIISALDYLYDYLIGDGGNRIIEKIKMEITIDGKALIFNLTQIYDLIRYMYIILVRIHAGDKFADDADDIDNSVKSKYPGISFKGRFTTGDSFYDTELFDVNGREVNFNHNSIVNNEGYVSESASLKSKFSQGIYYKTSTYENTMSTIDRMFKGADIINKGNSGNDIWGEFLNSQDQTTKDYIADNITNETLFNAFRNIYDDIIESMIEFPNKYLTDLLDIADNENIMYNKKTLDTFRDVFNTFYLTESDVLSFDKIFSSKSISTDNDQDIFSLLLGNVASVNNEEGTIELRDNISEEDRVLYYTTFLEVLDNISSIFATEEFMRITMDIGINIASIAKFVEAAIRIFISYTTDIYETRSSITYNNKSECFDLSEKVVKHINSIKTDYVYNDNTLKIRKV